MIVPPGPKAQACLGPAARQAAKIGSIKANRAPGKSLREVMTAIFSPKLRDLKGQITR